jgi:hypothetical protein
MVDPGRKQINLEEQSHEVELRGSVEADEEMAEAMMGDQLAMGLAVEGRGSPAPPEEKPKPSRRKSAALLGESGENGSETPASTHQQKFGRSLDKAAKQASAARVYALKLAKHHFREMSSQLQHHAESLEQLYAEGWDIMAKPGELQPGDTASIEAQLQQRFGWCETCERTVRNMDRDIFSHQKAKQQRAKGKADA